MSVVLSFAHLRGCLYAGFEVDKFQLHDDLLREPVLCSLDGMSFWEAARVPCFQDKAVVVIFGNVHHFHDLFQGNRFCLPEGGCTDLLILAVLPRVDAPTWRTGLLFSFK